MVTALQKKILHGIRANARAGFSSIGRANKIPVTTVFENYWRMVESGLVKQHVCVVDFRKLGYFQRVFFTLRGRDKDALLEFLSAQRCVNSICKVSGADFSADCVFPTSREFYDFRGALELVGLERLEYHEIYEHVKVEGFKV